jgi:adenine deaminase
MLREGSLRQDLETTLRPLIQSGADLRRVILVTDSMMPEDVAEHGHMDHVVRRAIALGLSPLQAIQMVTLNPAVYSGLEQEIGGVAPGRMADMVLIDDFEQCRVEKVIVGGKIVAENDTSLIDRIPIAVPNDFLLTRIVNAEVSPSTFQIPLASVAAKIRVMELLNQTITRERIIEVRTRSGRVAANVDDDLLKLAMFDRRYQRPVAFGFLKGFGARVGAVALTVNLDENSLMVIGSSDEDMALCAAALVECGGGIAIAHRGRLIEKFELPAAGLFSMQPWREVGRRLSRIQQLLREYGSPFDKPTCPLIFLPFVTLPALRITARGLINVKERRIVPLFVED